MTKALVCRLKDVLRRMPRAIEKAGERKAKAADPGRGPAFQEDSLDEGNRYTDAPHGM